jgi:primosomal protein N''
MGLVTGLLTLPLAPVRGVNWLAERLLDQAYAQELSPEAIRRQLIVAQTDLEEGRMTEQEYDEVEEILVARLMATRRDSLPAGGAPTS